jgi:hypothetical protein
MQMQAQALAVSDSFLVRYLSCLSIISVTLELFEYEKSYRSSLQLIACPFLLCYVVMSLQSIMYQYLMISNNLPNIYRSTILN